MRLFIASPVNFILYNNIKNSLKPFINGKWVEGWNLHLTHHFIGEDDPEKYKFELKIPKEEITLTSLGILNDRILYIKPSSDSIDAIYKQLKEKFNLKNNFHPHITLCRMKSFDKKLKEKIKDFNFNLKIPFEVYLYSSKLTKKGQYMKKSINMAVALKYKAYEDNAPKIVAKGKGELAKKIIQKAKEFDIPLFQNELLVENLMKVKSEEIPPELYKAVAEVFAWLYKVEQNAQMSRS